MRFRPCLLAAMLCTPCAALAQDANGERDSLLALLDEQTALATKTRLNADYVPGILSVLHGRDLELRGVRTVWEALALVPGMERAMEPNGRRKLLVRGVGNIWSSGNVKLLLNNVALNTPSAASPSRCSTSPSNRWSASRWCAGPARRCMASSPIWVSST